MKLYKPYDFTIMIYFKIWKIRLTYQKTPSFQIEKVSSNTFRLIKIKALQIMTGIDDYG